MVARIDQHCLKHLHFCKEFLKIGVSDLVTQGEIRNLTAKNQTVQLVVFSSALLG